MKILDVRFRNLNSLRGDWHIDLSDKIYESNGIFAITGPTGAGKTTIFDAICLALYGRTSRLRKVSKSTNEIISIGADECFAQVIFSTEAGTFTSKWGQSIINGKLQAPEHHLSDEISQKPLTSKLENTLREIEKVTGMDFKRFTKAMMLEQGGFDAFLKADRNERAEILELITGTEIYSEISRRVYQRCKDEIISLKELEFKLNDAQAQIPEGGEQAVISLISAKNTEASALESQHEQTKNQREALREIRRLEEELTAKQADIADQTKRIEAFEHDRKILDAAERAETLKADYSRLTSLRENREKSLINCERLRKNIASSEANLAKINAELPEAQKLHDELKGEIQEAPDTAAARIKALVDNQNKAASERERLKNDGIKANLKFEASKANSRQKDEARKSARQKVEKANQAYNEAFDKLIQSRARTVDAVLAEQRAILKPNAPCPLCGSLEHPDAEKILECTEKSNEAFKRTEKLEAELKKLSDALEKLRAEQDKADKAHSQAQASEAAAEKELEALRSNWLKKNDECKKIDAEVKEAVKPLKLASSENVIEQVSNWTKKVNSLEQNIQSSEKRKSELEASIKTLTESLEPERENLEALSQKLADFERDFALKLSEKNFADEKEFINSCKDTKKLQHLQDRRREITDRMNELLTLRDDIARKLDIKRSQVPQARTLDETEKEFKAQEAQIKALNGTIAVLTQKLNDAKILQAKICELTENCDAQRLKVSQWKALNELIGSAQGDRLRRFAQKITLDIVLKNANEYLRKMNGRYILLLRPDSENLELSVIDSEQAGEIRPTENLSGGERFIVSLALALGLSQISGSKTGVDSLFLDEGFGTLDEDAMNTALDALGEIHREGRMIGIISHVQTLKERIAAQIQVIPKSEGVSILEGPGCSGKL